jgi:soluble lytic murein transglycosylase-like protein
MHLNINHNRKMNRIILFTIIAGSILLSSIIYVYSAHNELKTNVKINNEKVVILQNEIDRLNKELNSPNEKIRFYAFADSIISLDRMSDLGTAERQLFIGHIWEYSNAFGISPFILLSVAKTESNYRSCAISEDGAKGIFQILPSTFYMCSSSLHDDLNRKDRTIIFDLDLQTKYATFYLRSLYDDCGRMDIAISRYNMGRTMTVTEYAKEVVSRQKYYESLI